MSFFISQTFFSYAGNINLIQSMMSITSGSLPASVANFLNYSGPVLGLPNVPRLNPVVPNPTLVTVCLNVGALAVSEIS